MPLRYAGGVRAVCAVLFALLVGASGCSLFLDSGDSQGEGDGGAAPDAAFDPNRFTEPTREGICAAADFGVVFSDIFAAITSDPINPDLTPFTDRCTRISVTDPRAVAVDSSRGDIYLQVDQGILRYPGAISSTRPS